MQKLRLIKKLHEKALRSFMQDCLEFELFPEIPGRSKILTERFHQSMRFMGNIT